MNWFSMQLFAVPQKFEQLTLLVCIFYLQDIDFQTVAEVHFMSETKTESMDPAVIDEIGTTKYV